MDSVGVLVSRGNQRRPVRDRRFFRYLAGERFIELNPTSPALDYALYLQGLTNFDDNLGVLGSFTGQDLSERDQQASRDAYQSVLARAGYGPVTTEIRPAPPSCPMPTVRNPV